MSNQTPHNALPAGYKLHWYEIKSILGQGGFGITYLAHDLNLAKDVAIKEYLPTEFSRRESDFTVLPVSDDRQAHYQWGLDRFITEARTLSKFEHPNIVKVHAVFEENNTGYMVMSYEYGKSLQDILQEQKTLDEQTLLSIIYPLMAGLELVHKHQFIHRDIKPDNIFIRNDGSPALLDFGSARQALSGQSKALTILVTPGYAPVEQYYSESDEQGPWTDIYGLGATLYRAISGQSLVNAVDRSKSILDNSKDSYVTALDIGKGNYSNTFLQAVDHAIQFKATDRPQTVADWRVEFPNDTQDGATTLLPHKSTKVKTSSKLSGVKVASMGVITALILGASYYFLQEENSPKTASLSTAEKPVKEGKTPNKKTVPSKDTDTIATPQPKSPAPKALEAEVTSSQEAAPPSPTQIEKALQEELRIERQRIEIEKQKMAADKKRLEEKVEAQRQEQIARTLKAQQVEKDILASRQIMSSRMATTRDKLPYQDSDKVINLTENQAAYTLSIAANSTQWQSTGISVQRGIGYTITAKGEWKMGAVCNSTDASGEGMYSFLCLDLGGQTVANYPHGALIGKIGRQALAFYIGPEVSFTAERDGVLYMISNDAPAFIGDNSQSLDVIIRLAD